MTTDVNRTRSKLEAIGNELSMLHLGDTMNEVILGGILAMLSKSHVLLTGMHGANKSRVIEDLFSRIEGADTFVLHGSAYASVEDVVGPVRLDKLDAGEYERQTKLKLPQAHFGYMDEIFECNDALVKVMHPIMNERHFSNNGPPQKLPLQSMFGATNVRMEDALEGKAAFVDRWHLRYEIKYPDNPELMKKILRMARGVPHTRPKTRTSITLQELFDAQDAVSNIEISETIDDAMCKIYKLLTAKNFELSPRRLVYMLGIIRASAWFRGHDAVDVADLNILRHSLWTKEEQLPYLCKVLASEAKSHVSQAAELLDAIRRLHKQFQSLPAKDPGIERIKEQVQEKAHKLTVLGKEYEAQGKDPKDIDKAYDEASKISYEISKGK